MNQSKNSKINYDRDTLEPFIKIKGYQEEMTRSFYERMNKLSIEAEQEQEQIINKEYIKVPLPAHNKIIRDRKFNFVTLASLMANSNKNIGDVKEMKFTNYIYENKLNEVMDFINNTCHIKMGKRTFDKHVKYIMSTGYDLIGLINTPNGLVYQLKAEIDGGYYVTIPYCQLKELLLCTNKDMLRLYIFLKDYIKTTDKFVTMDRSFIARSLGLNGKTPKNLDNISTWVNALARLGYIEIKTVIRKEVNESDPTKIQVKTVNSYSLRTISEWEAIKEIANGKVKK